MGEAGYALKPAPVRLSDRAVAIVFLAVLAVSMGCGYLFFNSYNMDWQPAGRAYDGELEEIKSHLVSLGFPEYVLEDLTEEDIRACKGALGVEAEISDHPINDGRRVAEERWGNTYYSTVYDVKELRTADIAVKLPGEQEEWKLFHHFLWTVNPGFCGTEALQIMPAYQRDAWGKLSGYTGQVLYDSDGETYASPYYTLRGESGVFAAFSLPSGGENQRGYVSYAIEEYIDGAIIADYCDYIHQSSRVQFPVMTADSENKRTSWNGIKIFITVDAGLLFYPDGEDLN